MSISNGEAMSATITEQIRHWTDIQFAVVMHREGDNLWVDFKAYEIVYCDDWDNPKSYGYYVTGWTSSVETIETIEGAQVYLSGSIKWDGCSNMQFDEQEKAMLHFCGKSNAMNIGTLLERLYDLAAEMMPEHAKDMA
jgi:hypothetical protein